MMHGIKPREEKHVQQAKEDVCQEDEKSDGHRNETDLASLNFADHAQYVAYLVTHRHLKKTSRERKLLGKSLGPIRQGDTSKAKCDKAIRECETNAE
jgi:hypothetical protein